MQIRHNLPNELKPAAALLYWQAFGGKLHFALGPDARAIGFLTRVIRGDHCLYVTDDEGALIGIAGFKSPGGGFTDADRRDFQNDYGFFGGVWRSWLLGMLESDVDNDRFLVDGISVAVHARNQGIGSALIEALIAEGRSRGYGAIRLEVIDANTRARALYERMGFIPWRSDRLGLLRHFFGFDGTTTLIRDI